MNQKHNDDLAQPIHPGGIEQRPFWNTFTRRFMWAPAFEMPVHPDAQSYLYEIVDAGKKAVWSFTALTPIEALSPVWLDLPCREYSLTVSARTSAGLVEVGKRDFIKSPSFQGVSQDPAYPYRESAYRSFRDLFLQDRARSWLMTGGPDTSYPKWSYPSKTGPAIIQAMLRFAKNSETTPQDQDLAVSIACHTADFLIQLIEPSHAPMAGFAPTYWEGAERDIGPTYPDLIMTSEPANVAQAFLDLYDFTQEKKYLQVAIGTAETYKNRQQANGSWYQWVVRKTGEPNSGHILIPTSVLDLLGRLEQQYGYEQYRVTAEAAMDFCLREPKESYCWNSQFEDTLPRQQYQNLSHQEASQLARLLFEGNDRSLWPFAAELARFVEDSFVIWAKDDPAARISIFSPGSRWYALDPDFGLDWILPSAVEQYQFFTPISASSANVIRMWVAAYSATENDVYLAKAVALANSITHAQRYYGGREIPTHLRKVKPELEWLNCGIRTAMALDELAPVLETYARS